MIIIAFMCLSLVLGSELPEVRESVFFFSF